MKGKVNREDQIFKVTIVGGVVNFLLLTFKFVAGFLGHSSAMIADAIHSLSDFATDIIVLVFVKISGKPADNNHKYGHGKYETLATALIGLALLAVAGIILFNGGQKTILWLRGENLPAPGWLAFWAAIVSIVAKEGVYQYTVHFGRSLDSQALTANAWHHRSDALSSIGTALGIGGALLLGQRWTILDPLASIVVGVLIVKVSVELLVKGAEELTEKSLPEETEKEILEIISGFRDVSEPHHLRTRRIGNVYAIEFHVRMDGNMTINESHAIVSEIEKALRDRYGESTIVTVHVEPVK